MKSFGNIKKYFIYSNVSIINDNISAFNASNRVNLNLTSLSALKTKCYNNLNDEKDLNMKSMTKMTI